MLLSGCATHRQFVCKPYFEPFELSPKSRHDNGYGITLISITCSRLVTIRLDNGKLARAHPGEEFKLRDGESAQGFRLRSVDIPSGRVIIEGEIFVMGAQ